MKKVNPKRTNLKANTSNKSVDVLSIPSDDIIHRLKMAAKPGWFSPVITLLDNTALRIGELCGNHYTYKLKSGKTRTTKRRGLVLKDVVNHTTAGIFVKSMITVVGKGSKKRSIPLNLESQVAIQDLIAYFGSFEDDHLLCPLHRKTVSSEIKKARELLGINSKVTPHSMRHRVLSKMVRNGSIKEAQILAGHSDPRITLGVYTHVSMEDVSNAVNLI